MKKIIYIFIISVLFIALVLCFCFVIKYKKQVHKLEEEINRLNITISKTNKLSNKLETDKNFIEQQYNDLKSVKSKSELIDVEIQECMKACKYTTVCMSDCVYQAGDKWEKEIDKNIKLLERIMNKEQIVLLHDSQKKWLAYKNAQQTLNSKTIGTKTGTMYINILSGEQVDIIKQRAKELDGLYYYLSNE